MARGPLHDQVVPSPVFIQPSASPPGLSVPRINKRQNTVFSAPILNPHFSQGFYCGGAAGHV
jgi:hypothetical protein